MTRPGPIPDPVAVELTRVVQRWRQLPLDHAALKLPEVHALLADLAGPPAPHGAVDLVMAQLRVLVYDACDHGAAEGLADRLAALRRSLA